MAERSDHNQYAPDEVSPPGETLEEILSANGMTQAELALRTGRPKKTINEIVKGKAILTSETAVQLERVLGVSASFWTTREAHFRAHLARLEEGRQLVRFVEWPQRFPLRDMRRLGWISATASGVDLVRELLTFFGVASPSTFDTSQLLGASDFRQSNKHTVDVCALSAWLRRGEREAIDTECASYDRTRFVAALSESRTLTRLAPEVFVPQLKQLMSSVGVAVAFVPELPRIRTNGATRWITSEKALIQLSLRYKRSDILWFTFFHEAGHLILHGKKDVFVEGYDQEKTSKENDADTFAAEMLIPSPRFKTFVVRDDFSAEAIEAFAASLGVHAGIVLGRLQHENLVPHASHPHLFMRLEWQNDTR